MSETAQVQFTKEFLANQGDFSANLVRFRLRGRGYVDAQARQSKAFLLGYPDLKRVPTFELKSAL